ncbi:hypothetical protein [Saccharolobus solfataricus]
MRYQCLKCGLIFYRKKTVVRHLRSEHNVKSKYSLGYFYSAW